VHPHRLLATLTLALLLGGALLADDPKSPDLPPQFRNLGLSDKQLEDAAKVLGKHGAKLKELEDKIKTVRDEQAAELEKLLTAAQKARLKELRAAEATELGGGRVVPFLKADFAELLAKEKDPAPLRKAARLLETSKQANSRDSLQALTILRQTRAKAGIPLLLRYIAEGPGATGRNPYVDTFIVLTGREIEGYPTSVPNRPMPAQDAVAELVRTWWLPNKATFTTDLGGMSREQRKTIARALLGEVEWEMHSLTHGQPIEQVGRRVSHILRPSLGGFPREWQNEDLHPSMLPYLLEQVGWEEDPAAGRPWRETYRIPFAAIPLIAALRKNGDLPDLQGIAADRRQNSATRLTCLLALAGAGEVLDTQPLLAILDRETKQERRIVAVLLLERCRDVNAAVPRLLKLLEDPDGQVRTAAVLALRTPRPKEAVPALMKLFDELPPTDVCRFHILRLLGDMGGKDVQVFLAGLLRKGLEETKRSTERSALLSMALMAFEEATGKRWTQGGSPTREIFHAQVKQALEWWDDQKEERER
jgi:hypothetical protein